MRFHASHERASRTAKRLRDVANDIIQPREPITLSTAQRALAAAWGYASWAELVQGSEDAPRSSLDEDSSPDLVATRAEDHAEALAKAFDVGLAIARAVVAEAGLTARIPPTRRREARRREVSGAGRAPGTAEGPVTSPNAYVRPAIRGIVDIGAVMAWAGACRASEVRFTVGRPVEAKVGEVAETLGPDDLSVADVESVVRYAYGEAGVDRVRSGHALAPWEVAVGLADGQSERFRMTVSTSLTLDDPELVSVTCRLVSGPSRERPGLLIARDASSGDDAWLTPARAREHVVLLGGTDAGRHSFMLALAAQHVGQGSACIVVDASGDPSRAGDYRAMARGHGKDLLVLDLRSEGSRSDTFNPFSTGGADALTRMVVALMDDTGGEGEMWQGRATAMFTGLMRALVHLRDNGLLDLDVGTIREHLDLRRIVDLTDRSKFPDMPREIVRSVSSYLTSLPGFQPEKGYRQAQATLDQHGFLQMQFTRIMGSMADVYGHVFMTPHADVDMTDVVVNRRVLLVTLPAMGRSKDEVANLGRIVVAAIGGVMREALGGEVEGVWDDIVDRRHSTSAAVSCGVILDEVGYYSVDGMDLMAAQARSLGFSMTYAARDARGMRSLQERHHGSVVGNANTKVVMAIDDNGTARLALEMAGKAFKPLDLADKAMPRAGRGSADGALRGIAPADLAALGDDEAYLVMPDGTVSRVKVGG